MKSMVALISSPRLGTGQPNSNAIRSIGPIIDFSMPSAAAANDTFSLATADCRSARSRAASLLCR
jgi:hypothetical protein